MSTPERSSNLLLASADPGKAGGILKCTSLIWVTELVIGTCRSTVLSLIITIGILVACSCRDSHKRSFPLQRSQWWAKIHFLAIGKPLLNHITSSRPSLLGLPSYSVGSQQVQGSRLLPQPLYHMNYPNQHLKTNHLVQSYSLCIYLHRWHSANQIDFELKFWWPPFPLLMGTVPVSEKPALRIPGSRKHFACSCFKRPDGNRHCMENLDTLRRNHCWPSKDNIRLKFMVIFDPVLFFGALKCLPYSTAAPNPQNTYSDAPCTFSALLEFEHYLLSLRAPWAFTVANDLRGSWLFSLMLSLRSQS